MSNPRWMAEDVARHYMEKTNSQCTHSTNVRRYLRLPVLAITRRILLPRMNYAELQQREAGAFGADVHVDPSFMKCKVGRESRVFIIDQLVSYRHFMDFYCLPARTGL